MSLSSRLTTRGLSAFCNNEMRPTVKMCKPGNRKRCFIIQTLITT